MKKLLIFMMMLVSLLSVAGANSLDANEMKASSYLRDLITRDLNRNLGMNEFYVKVSLKINEEKLAHVMGVKDVQGGQYETLNLPGLYLEGQKDYWKTKLSEATVEDILVSLTSLQINIDHHDELLTQAEISESIQKLTQSYLPDLAPSAVKVEVALSPMIRKKLPVAENTVKAPLQVQMPKAPLQIITPEGAFAKFWNKYFIPLAAAACLLVGLLFFFQNRALKSGFQTVSDVIKSKSGSASSARNSDRRDEVEKHAANSDDLNSFKSYTEAIDYLRVTSKGNKHVFEEVLVLKVMAEDFRSMVILLDSFESAQKEIFLANLPKDKRARFKSFLLEDGSNFMKDDVAMKNETVKLIKLVKIASYSPEDLAMIVLADLCHYFNRSNMTKLLDNCSEREKSILVEFFSADRLAFYLQEGTLSMDLVSDMNAAPPKHQELMNVIVKASVVLNSIKASSKKEKMESVYAQLDLSKASLLADALDIRTEHRFENLFAKHFDSAMSYLEGLKFEELSSLFGLLDESMQDQIVENLPELLSERLKFSKKVTSHESLKAKGDFYQYLRSLENDSSPHVRQLRVAS